MRATDDFDLRSVRSQTLMMIAEDLCGRPLNEPPSQSVCLCISLAPVSPRHNLANRLSRCYIKEASEIQFEKSNKVASVPPRSLNYGQLLYAGAGPKPG